MGCSNCFNGCTDIISDQCVKYTGNNFSLIGYEINTGDSLLMVEQAILDLLSEMNNGDGIQPVADVAGACTALGDLLPNGNDSTLNDVLEAISTVLCQAVSAIEALQAFQEQIEGDYVVDCLAPGVAPDSGTHDILQAVIDKLCELEGELDVLAAFVATEVVTQDELPTLIQDYLDNSPITSLVNNKMIPFVAYPFFGDPTGKFDINGAGIGDWDKIYLCNGTSHPVVPDLRGRTLVGATTMGPPPFNPVVDPSIPGNPTYTMTGINAEQGANQIILGVNQMPNHTHPAKVNIADPGHVHTGIGSAGDSGESSGYLPSLEDIPEDNPIYTTNSSMTGLKGNVNDPVSPNVTVVNDSQGGGDPHPNVQPSRACLYIMYIP